LGGARPTRDLGISGASMILHSPIGNFTSRALVALTLLCAAFAAQAQTSNVNNLPPCPRPDFSKNTDSERFAKFHNCWGRYRVELNKENKGDILEGEWRDGGLFNKGTYSYASGNKYAGEFKDGYFHGQGTYTWNDGNRYVGEFKQGKRSGPGTYFYISGDRHIGEYEDDKPNGIGTYFYLADNANKGDKFIGGYKDGRVSGAGAYRWANGDEYVGEFKDGFRNGQGIYSFTDGRRQEGFWVNDKFTRETKIDVPLILSRYGLDLDQVQMEPSQSNASALPPCPRPDASKKTDLERFAKWHNCWGRYRIELEKDYKGDVLEGEWRNGLLNGFGSYAYGNGDKYVGDYKDGKPMGQGTYTYANGDRYVGEFKGVKRSGKGIFTFVDGKKMEGIWENDKFVREAKVTLPNNANGNARNRDRDEIDRERQQLAEERRRLDEDKRQREQARATQRLSLQVSHTQPDPEGGFSITIQANADTASLKIDGIEEGGRADGVYQIKRVARAAQTSNFKIVATDVFGNTDSRIITVSRTLADSSPRFVSLNPANVRTRPASDAVAIIIGIQNYKRVPKAEFANEDARAFYDYAIRALGVRPEHIKLMLDEQADEVEILAAFQNWLPVKVKKSKTDVYVFYSGHGLPGEDGKSLYILPQGADRQFIAKTALNQQEIIAALQAVKPKSVTMFMDACYSGQIRTGDTLIASARPLALSSTTASFPSEFTVFTASAPDQIASSSPDLKHGIFSYYLMKGMEGDADENRDGKITAAELQTYILEMVGKQAMTLNRRQEPQMVGDLGRVLVGR
jgi:hypothetical protein